MRWQSVMLTEDMKHTCRASKLLVIDMHTQAQQWPLFRVWKGGLEAARTDNYVRQITLTRAT